MGKLTSGERSQIRGCPYWRVMGCCLDRGIRKQSKHIVYLEGSQDCMDIFSLINGIDYYYNSFLFIAVVVAQSLMSNSLWPHGLQHTRLSCPPPSPRASSNSCPLSWWCHPTILSSVITFSSCLQSLSTSESFPMSHLFASGGQSIGASVSVLPVHIKDWFPLGLIDLLAVQGTLKSLLQHHSSEASVLQCSAFFMVQLSHPYMTTGKTITFD